MSPVERLQAAIEKLEEIQAESRNWRVHLSSEDGPQVVHEFDTDGYGPGYGTLAWTNSAEGATRIVTLHRTIDAQLTMMRSAVEWLGQGNNAAIAAGSDVFASQLGPELALAEAILGSEAELSGSQS